MKGIIDSIKKNRISICLLLGLIFLMFGTLYLFTRPCLIPSFDFSKTGEIGDTIGGITAPIINLVGAFLVYLSFKAQVNANEIQYGLLKSQIENGRNDRNFEITYNLFSQIKTDFLKLGYKEFKGKNAINIYINELKGLSNNEQITKHLNQNIRHEFNFILDEYKLIITRIKNVEMNDYEKRQIFYISYSFYSTYLHFPSRVLRKTYEEYNIEKYSLQVITDIIERHKFIEDSFKV